MKLLTQQTIASPKKEALRVMTYNIRMAPCPEDEGTENAWKHRLPKVALLIKEYLPDIIGLQEISELQEKTLRSELSSLPFDIVSRTPSRPPVESGLGIAYNPHTLSLDSAVHTIWLNEKRTTPHAPAWDGSHYERFIIYARFTHKVSKSSFWFTTTHFDHMGQQARTESAHIIIELAQQLDGPVILTGDFNCFPQLGGHELYKLLSSHELIQDTHKAAQTTFGVPGSWIGWKYDRYRQQNGFAKYDYIFSKGISSVLQEGVIDDRVIDSNLGKELYPSDHRPVLSDLIL